MRLEQMQAPWVNDGEQFLADSFDRRTMWDMEVALDKACAGLPSHLNVHQSRTFIAKKIIERVRNGGATQGMMTSVALAAVDELSCEEAGHHQPA